MTMAEQAPETTLAPSGAKSRKARPFPSAADLAATPIAASQVYGVRYLNCTANKPLHLGHLRNLALGDAVVESLRALGFRAVRHCIFEDTGHFMAEAMVALHDLAARGEPVPLPGQTTDHFVGAIYADYRKRRANGKDAGPATASPHYNATDTRSNAMMRALLCAKPEAVALRDRVRDLALSGQQATLRRMGVKFDYCDFESAEDADIAGFVGHCEAKGLLSETDKGARFYAGDKGGRLRIQNEAGLFEESSRLLSFNARIAQAPAGAYQTLVLAGSEWREAMSLYAEFLAGADVRSPGGYLPTFYGMVVLNGKKMASSTGNGVLIDDLLDRLGQDQRLVDAARRDDGRAVDDLAGLIIRAFLLLFPRTATIDFSWDRLFSAEDNPGWDIVDALGRSPRALDGDATGHAQRLVHDAASRRSFEDVFVRLRELAADVRRAPDSPRTATELRWLARSVGLLPDTHDFSYRLAASLMTAPSSPVPARGQQAIPNQARRGGGPLSCVGRAARVGVGGTTPAA